MAGDSTQRTLARISQGGVLLALAGAVWVSLAGQTCGACHEATQLLGIRWSGPLGVVFYAAVLIRMRIRCGTDAIASGLILAAAGAHLVLVTMLFKNGTFCPACLTTALGVFTAMIACVLHADFTFRRYGWSFPVAAVATILLVSHLQQARARENERLGRALLQEVLAEERMVPSNHVTLLLYVRHGCRHCLNLQSNCLPALQSNLGDRLNIETRAAPDDLPTPTVILVGAHPTFLVGNHPCAVFLRAVTNSLALVQTP